MDLIESFQHLNNQYSRKIKTIKYTEGEKVIIEKEGVKDICELIIGNNELEYNNIEKSHRNSFIVNKKLELAGEIKKDERYSKKFSSKLIQNGLQEINYLSSILYLNEIYKIHCVIYNSNTKKYYHTSYRNYPKVVCLYKNNTWFIDDTLEVPNESSDVKELSTIITLDSDVMIFKTFLNPISKYKISELEDKCREINIKLLKSNGKKKLKKELYDEINLYEIKKD